MEEQQDVSLNQQGFAALYARYFERLTRLCLRRVHDRAAAEDLAQEALLRAYAGRDRFDPARPLWPWLKTIAMNVARDVQGRDRRIVLGEPADLPAPCTDLHRIEDRLLLARAMLSLTPAQRRAVRLRYIGDMEPLEAARSMDMTRPAFNQLLFRGRVRLRHALRQLGETTPVVFPIAALRGTRAFSTRLVARLRIGPNKAAYEALVHASVAMCLAILVVAGVRPVPASGRFEASRGDPVPSLAASLASDETSPKLAHGDRNYPRQPRTQGSSQGGRGGSHAPHSLGDSPDDKGELQRTQEAIELPEANDHIQYHAELLPDCVGPICGLQDGNITPPPPPPVPPLPSEVERVKDLIEI